MEKHPFRVAVEAGDLDAMVETLAPDVRFYSPVTFKPFEGRDATAHVLGAVIRVFEDFAYTHEFGGDGAHALVFRAKAGGREVQGLDLLDLNSDGLVETLTVMVRPLSATLALRDAMGRELGVTPG